MKDIIMTIVRMFVLIFCSIIQIIAAIFQLVALATGKAGVFMKTFTENLLAGFDRGCSKINNRKIVEQAE
jgi:hypothetical protein